MLKKVKLPRDVVIDRMMKDVNGVENADPMRSGYLSRERAALVIDAMRATHELPMHKDAGNNFVEIQGAEAEALRKDVTLATGLTFYDLRAPALNLFPTVTPLRNSIARNSRTNPGDSLHYKVILATTGSGFPYMGWVPEGQRSASMTYQSTTVTLPYATLGEEDSLTDEAKYAAMGFEDEDALVQLRLLLKMFVKEEAGILGGNQSLALGTPTAPTLSTAALTTAQQASFGVATATLPAATYSVIAVALTQEGYLNSSVAGGVATTLNITGNDGKAYTLNGGSSNKSANSTQAVTLGNALNCSVPYINGAVAWAWFVGTAGNEKLQAITTINSACFYAPLVATTQGAVAISADCSKNVGVAFDGLLTTTFNNAPANNAYVYTAPTGVAGIGTGLTPSGKGGIVEIDNMFLSMWARFKISPTVIYVNAQELNNITTKVLSNTSAPLLRYNVEADQAGMVEYKLTASGVVSFYFNPYTADGGVRIPIKIHPNLAPGTIIAWAERLPAWYVSNETPVVAEMLTRRDYYNELWPRTTRQQYYGVYTQEALAVYAPFSLGILNNLGNL